MAFPCRNRLLSAVSAREFHQVSRHLHGVSVAAGQPLPQCGEARVYFPGSSACSVQNRMSDGRAIEVACVGSEGVVGLPALGATLPGCAYGSGR
jgi:hypothetical protein